jgi:regulator of protease activity HflC (stomatin/prohibitin superfamily)
MQPLGQLCSVINDIPHTVISGVWFWISFAFSHYWYLIIPALIVWVTVEIITRNAHSFNSDNGFTPVFNSFVGGGVFYIFEYMIYFVLNYFLGSGVNCGLLWLDTFYLIPFIATGLFLHGIGFWPYMKIPILNIKIDLRTVTLPVPAQKIITKDNVSVDVSAVAYYRIVDVIKSIVAIQNVEAAIDQIAQTSLRNIVGKFQLDEILSERETINSEITKILDSYTESWGVVVSSVEIKDIQLPDDMQRAIAKQAEAEREKRAKIISAEGEFLSAQKLADTADIMMAHPIALQLRNLQTLAEIATEKNSTIIFPAQLMGTVSDIQNFLNEEKKK